MKKFKYLGFECESTETGCKLQKEGLMIAVNIKSKKKLMEYIDEIAGNAQEENI